MGRPSETKDNQEQTLREVPEGWPKASSFAKRKTGAKRSPQGTASGVWTVVFRELTSRVGQGFVQLGGGMTQRIKQGIFVFEVEPMSSDQLKALVIERVLYEQDETTLHELLNRLTHTPERMVLTPEQNASIDAGLADYAAGRVVTQEELKREEAGWL